MAVENNEIIIGQKVIEGGVYILFKATRCFFDLFPNPTSRIVYDGIAQCEVDTDEASAALNDEQVFFQYWRIETEGVEWYLRLTMYKTIVDEGVDMPRMIRWRYTAMSPDERLAAYRAESA